MQRTYGPRVNTIVNTLILPYALGLPNPGLGPTLPLQGLRAFHASYRLNGDCLIGLASHYRHQSPALPAASPAIIGTKIEK